MRSVKMRAGLFVLVAALLSGCRAAETRPAQVIEFTRIPAADRGGPEIVDTIEGRARTSDNTHRIVVFVRNSGVWWVQPGPDQPYPDQPYTHIQPDSTWRTSTQLGSEYVAALVRQEYRPPRWVSTLPPAGGPVDAVAVVPGDSSKRVSHPSLQFSGYEWLVRASPSNRGGQNAYDPANAWTDSDGALHLRIARSDDKSTSAQVILTRSLGYGTYHFVTRDLSQLDPAAVLALYTLDDVGAAATDRNPREWDVEFSRWGDATSQNARFLLQPAYLPDNTIRFDVPAGPLTHTVKWEPGHVTFTTVRGRGEAGAVVTQHVASTSVPTPGNERFRINFYDFQRGPTPLKEGAEVVIEKFVFEP